MKERKVVGWLVGYSRWCIWNIVLLSLMSGAIAGSFILLALVSSRVLDIATGQMSGHLGLEVLSLIGIILLQGLLNVLNSHLRVHTSTRLEMAFRQGIFKKLLRKRYEAVTYYHSGEILNRLTSDVEIVVNSMVSLIPQAVSMATKIVAGMGVLFVIDARFTFFILVVGVLLVMASRLYSRHFKYLHKEVQRTNGVVRSFMQECLENLMVVKTFEKDDSIINRLEVYQKENYKIRIKRVKVSNYANTLVYLVFTFGYYGALAWGALQISRGIITFGTLTAFLQILQQIKAPFRNVSGLIPQYYTMQASAERLMELEMMEDESFETIIEDVKTFSETLESLVVEDLTFGYDKDHKVLDHCSVNFKKGELTLLVGESGAGKSTLMKLLLDFMPYEKGHIYFKTTHGIIPLDAGSRSVFSYVPQGNMMMSGTIRDNLTFCHEGASDQDLQHACEVACIWDYIETLPLGLDTPLKERGDGLSMGQVQRLAIARAILDDAPILLLDECTASLDASTEQQVLKNLKALHTKTIICISHTNAAKAYCDAMLVMVDKTFKLYKK